MPGNITKREKALGLLTAGVIAAALVYNFVVDPLAKRWYELREEIIDKEGRLKKNNKIMSNKEIIEELHSRYMRFFQTKGRSSEEESAGALSTIEKLARSANARITNIKPLPTKQFENYTKYTFRVSLESPIDNLTKFMYELQSSDHLLKVERIVLRAKERDPATIKAMLNITKISIF